MKETQRKSGRAVLEISYIFTLSASLSFSCFIHTYTYHCRLQQEWCESLQRASQALQLSRTS